MAWKHRKRRANDSDIIDPDDWNEDARNFADEMNGFLDRDNISERELGHSHVADGSFNSVVNKRKFGENNWFTLSGESTRYEGSLASYTLNATDNGMLICEFSGELGFTNPATRNYIKGIANYKQMVDIRLLVDGESICLAPSISEFSYHQPFYLCGAIPIEAGFHHITVEARTAMALDEHGGTQMVASFNSNSRCVTFGNRELLITFRRR